MRVAMIGTTILVLSVLESTEDPSGFFEPCSAGGTLGDDGTLFSGDGFADDEEGAGFSGDGFALGASLNFRSRSSSASSYCSAL